MQDTRWDELRSTKLGFSKRAPASAEPPYHAQKVQKNRKQLSPPIFQHHDGNKLASDKVGRQSQSHPHSIRANRGFDRAAQTSAR